MKTSQQITSIRKEIPYQAADELFSRLSQSYPQHHFLMESEQVSLFSGRFSLIGIDAPLHLYGKDENFVLSSLKNRGQDYLEMISPGLFELGDVQKNAHGYLGTVSRSQGVVEESQRCKQSNISDVIRYLLERFQQDDKTLMGLYGAFSYDYVRLFESLDDQLAQGETPDFSLMLFDRFLFFDHIKERAEIVCYDLDTDRAHRALEEIEHCLQGELPALGTFRVSDSSFALSEEQFITMATSAQELIRDGELFQVVFSNFLQGHFEGSAYALYQKYRKINPSPYLYYFDFGDEQLVGASPEMMVRCEENIVHLRPIAGTIPRGVDPIDDHEQMLKLLNDDKEKAELDMLVDLGRNDLSRICTPGIDISDYRFIEKYSRVMHTVAHLKGQLQEGYCGLDALISCLNAGTLTGSPKVAAMKAIEKHEPVRRGYYGGAVGQLTFSGEVDTAIMIRTAHIKDQQIRYQSGAGIVYDSDPRKEYQETLHKAQAFLESLE